MSQAPGRIDRLSTWCGAVAIGVMAITPLLAWLGPLGFAVLVALAGLLCLPALRVERDDRLILVLLLSLLAWAAISTLWSRFHPTRLQGATGLKLGFELLLYGAAVCGARRADPRLARRALMALAWGLAALGVLLASEAFTDAAIYRSLRAALHQPLAFPYAAKNEGHSSFVLALLWPVAAAAGTRAGAPRWLALPMAVGLLIEAHAFGADAPVLSVGLGLLAAGLVWTWPDIAPRVAGLLVVAAFLLMPFQGMIAHPLNLAQRVPLSWSERLGYWDAASALIGKRPWIGWGLDASRTFDPDIHLHPHNGALQLWLELGAPGVALGALVWLAMFWTLSSPRRDLLTAAAAASAVTFLLFTLVSFGVWQEWFLSLAALIAMVVALGRRAAPTP